MFKKNSINNSTKIKNKKSFSFLDKKMFFFSKNCLADIITRPSLFAHANCKNNEAKQNITENVSTFKFPDPNPLICVKKIITEINSQHGDYLALVLSDGTSHAFGCINKNLLDSSISYDALNCKIKTGSVFLLNEYSIVNKSENLYRNFQTMAKDSFNDHESLIGYSDSEIIIINLEKLTIVGEQDNSANAIRAKEVSKNNANTIEIKDLNSHLRNTNWQLKVCLSNISQIRDFKDRNTGAQGKTMRLQFYDTSGYVEVVFFNAFCAQFAEDYLKINTRYIIRNADIKFSNNAIKSWPDKSGSVYDLHFNKKTEITIDDDQREIEKIFENEVLEEKPTKQSASTNDSFVELNKVTLYKANSLIRTTVIVTKINELGSFEKYDKKIELRRIEVIDNTVKKSIKVALWGKQAIDCDFEPGHIYQFDDILLTTWAGRSLSVLKKTEIQDVTEKINLSIVKKLSSWWEKEKSNWLDNEDIKKSGSASESITINTEKRKLNESDKENENPEKKEKINTLEYTRSL